MWFHRKNTAPAYSPPSSAPISHRRVPAVADTTLRDLVLADADRLDASAADADARADQLLADAAKWRVLAAEYRRFAAQYDTPPQPVLSAPWAEPVREPSYDDPQPVPEPDPSRFNPTWQIPAPQPSPIGCACRWRMGETCERCDEFATGQLSILTPWSAPGDASTEQFPALNGDPR